VKNAGYQIIIVSKISPTITKILPRIIKPFFRESSLAIKATENQINNNVYNIIKYINSAVGARTNDSIKLQHSNIGYNHNLFVPNRLLILKKTDIMPINKYGEAKITPIQNSQLIFTSQPMTIQISEIPLIIVAPKMLLVSSLLERNSANLNILRNFCLKISEKYLSSKLTLFANLPNISRLSNIPPKIVANINPDISNIFAKCKSIVIKTFLMLTACIIHYQWGV